MDKSIEKEIVGTWLYSHSTYQFEGSEPKRLFANKTIGQLVYDPIGYMGVQIYQYEDTKLAIDEKLSEEALNTLHFLVLSYGSYYAEYKFNYKKGIIEHHILASSFVKAGTVSTRKPKLDGNTLQLIFNLFLDHCNVTFIYFWERMKVYN